MVNKGTSDSKKTNNTDSGPADKPAIPLQRIPTIRLKLKVGSEPVETAGAGAGAEADKVVGSVIIKRVKESTEPVPESVNEISETPAVSPSPSTNSANSTKSHYCGTFKYRPFKLFPPLPPSSLYRVLIPLPYTSPSHNPAIPLNYLWSTGVTGVYTDDSDLVCVAVREGWCRMKEIQGKEMMVEVEVVDRNSEGNQDIEPSRDIESKYSDTPQITPRVYSSPHDGHHFRILSVTLNPSAVHLKRWRKHKRSRGDEERILTPKFKTGY